MKTIYYNGAVYTGELPLAEAFAVEDGRFLFAGSNEEAVKLAATGTSWWTFGEILCVAGLTTATCICWGSATP